MLFRSLRRLQRIALPRSRSFFTAVEPDYEHECILWDKHKSKLFVDWKFESDEAIGGASECTIAEDFDKDKDGNQFEILRIDGKLAKDIADNVPLRNMPLYATFISMLAVVRPKLHLQNYAGIKMRMKVEGVSSLILNGKDEGLMKPKMMQATVPVAKSDDYVTYIVPFREFVYMSEEGHCKIAI